MLERDVLGTSWGPIFAGWVALRGKKTISLANLSIYYTWQNIKDEYKNNKFKITAPAWNETFDLPDGSYTIADIQDYFLEIVKKHESDITFKSSSAAVRTGLLWVDNTSACLHVRFNFNSSHHQLQ